MPMLKINTEVIRKNHSDEYGNKTGTRGVVVEYYSHEQWEYGDLVVIRILETGQIVEWSYDNFDVIHYGVTFGELMKTMKTM